MSQLFHIVYASTASKTFSRDDLKEMIKGSVRQVAVKDQGGDHDVFGVAWNPNPA